MTIDSNLGAPLLIASLYKKKKGNYVILCDNLYSAERVYEFLLSFFSEKEIIFFPNDELLRAETISSSKEFMAQRLYAIGKLLEPGKHILISHPSALLRYEPDPDFFRKMSFKLEISSQIEIDFLKNRLIELGYQRVNKVDQSLQFALRGDILDIYSVNNDRPIRIEFFDNEIESIREFDPATQGSTKELKSIEILPANDLLLSEDDINSFAERLKERIEADSEFASDKDALKQNVFHDLEKYLTHDYKPSLYRYYGFALNKAFSILDYIDPDLVFMTDQESFMQASGNLIEEANHYYYELFKDNLLCTHLSQYMPVEKALKGNIVYGHRFAQSSDSIDFNTRPIVRVGAGMSGALETMYSYIKHNKSVLIAISEPHQYEAISKLMEEEKIEYKEVDGFDFEKGTISLSRASLNEGFEIPTYSLAVLSANDLFGRRVSSSRFTSRFKNATILRSYSDLRPGDYVVHEYNGIGQFLEIATLVNNGIHRDYLKIAYGGNEKLYVPLEQFRLVRKYSAREGAAPRLSHLSTGDWVKKKAHIKERVDELAERLIDLYGKRTRLKGYSFPPDDEFQKQFEADFPYELTPDQERSLLEIKADMESDTIMDRLLCGDVGFGKTELAFRAAFKAILSGKQAAILCPTTLLARQHYELALSRFESFGVHVCLFSRLVPESIQKDNIPKVKSGEMNLVIGTHRLLSKEIEFNDLGLLVVDEEQRFGVEQKERIKELKNNVDVLTLSATPIPRTMQMSLVGIRALSEINTPPENRSPIQTYVTAYNMRLIGELIQRELARNGQVFYVHNKIMGIYERAHEIQGFIPHANVGVVHGRMNKEEIEDVMSQFYDGSLSVLVATSVVENGIDVPNANMIIVEDADRLGLSQLYQIKGRVGRGNRIAYAYLMYKPEKRMSEEAQKRLKAIQEFTELGSGYKIAQRDLMIRGAGDILGAEQAGFIDTIGLDLYLKMLSESIEEKKTGLIKEAPKPRKLFQIDAYIPDDYAKEGDKLEIYQSIEEAKDENELKKIVKRVKDIYGKLPKGLLLLFQKKRVDLLLSGEEFSEIMDQKESFDIFLSQKFSSYNGIGQELFEMLIPYLKIIKITFLQKKLRLRLEKREEWLDDLEAVTSLIHRLYARHKGASV